jgi:hypothetical protein
LRLGPKKNSQKKPPKKDIVINSEKKWTVINPSDVEWKKTTHLVDRMTNWCIGGC